jgi:hypothetical protein
VPHTPKALLKIPCGEYQSKMLLANLCHGLKVHPGFCDSFLFSTAQSLQK